MTTRITFNMTSDETLRIVDEYCHTHKLSRSKVIDALLSATAPVLNDINCYYQLAGKLQSRLLNGVYQRDLPHKRNVVSAEKYCLEIWENKLFTKRILEFDSSNGVLYALKHKRHYRRDKMIGRVESRRIKDICEYQMQLSGEKAKYACFIYIDGFAPIFPDTCYHLTHYWLAAVDIPVASDNPVHYADAIRYNARMPLQGSLLPLTRLVWA